MIQINSAQILVKNKNLFQNVPRGTVFTKTRNIHIKRGIAKTRAAYLK